MKTILMLFLMAFTLGIFLPSLAAQTIPGQTVKLVKVHKKHRRHHRHRHHHHHHHKRIIIIK
ncbi:MAG TPA: hypothetical protein VMD27_07525 [Candidatus Aquilonibacter sp.]|nr:hypothetical protein [Candidatus Aquilonibacter sp.]